ncbi:MAG: DUF350 domain-containing protein [bacterium]|nr:DUF350 domain-containing protein [bacterium]
MDIAEIVFVVMATLALLALARWILQWFLGNTLQVLLTDHDNPAMGLAVAGYLFGVIWTVTVLMSAPGRGLWQDILDILLYGVLGILLLTVVSILTCRLFLGMHVRDQLEDHNVAAAIVVAGVYVATSLTYSGALKSEGGGLLLLLFFVLGQLALLGMTYLFRWLTSYDDVQEIASGNIAAGLALSGLLIAMGIIVGNAASGSFTSQADSIVSFVLGLLVFLIFYPVRQVVVQGLILGGRLSFRAILLDQEIAQDRNTAAGLLEAVSYISTALFIVFVV